MVQVTVTDEMREKLQGLDIALELYDEDGYLCGRLEPVVGKTSAQVHEKQTGDVAAQDE